MQDVPINRTLYTLTLLYISNHIIIMLNKECTPTNNVHLQRRRKMLLIRGAEIMASEASQKILLINIYEGCG